MKQLLTVLAMIVAFAAPAMAIDFTVTGATLAVTYTEPSQNACGAPSPTCPALTDLSHTNVYVQVGSGPEIKQANIPATAAVGGGVINTTVTVPIVAGQEAIVTISATGTDLSDNESVKSASVTKKVDRLSPGSPN